MTDGQVEAEGCKKEGRRKSKRSFMKKIRKTKPKKKKTA